MCFPYAAKSITCEFQSRASARWASSPADAPITLAGGVKSAPSSARVLPSRPAYRYRYRAPAAHQPRRTVRSQITAYGGIELAPNPRPHPGLIVP